MKRKRILHMVLAFSTLMCAGNAAYAVPIAEMTPSEVGVMLASAPGIMRQVQKSQPGVEVDAQDMMTKVYGIIPDRKCGKADCVALNATEEEGGYFWLDSCDGYRLDYGGMTPLVSAAARIGEGDRLEEYCYFFLFPYDKDTKDDVTRDQAEFSGTLLQDMADHCRNVGAAPATDDLFTVGAEYADNAVYVRLIDEDSRGRYILMLVVDPGAAVMALD